MSIAGPIHPSGAIDPFLKLQPNTASSSVLPGTAIASVSIKQAFTRLLREPQKYLLRRWNWKSAVLSSLLRASLFFFTNLTAGLHAALAAMTTELLFRAVTSGFYGAITEAFRDADPPWAAAISVMILLPFANHSIEFLVHWLRGTHNLVSSILASVILTSISSLFNWYAMRRGAFIVGRGRDSLLADLLRFPRLFLDFLLHVPKHLLSRARHEPRSGSFHGH